MGCSGQRAGHGRTSRGPRAQQRKLPELWALPRTPAGQGKKPQRSDDRTLGLSPLRFSSVRGPPNFSRQSWKSPLSAEVPAPTFLVTTCGSET